MATDTTGYLEKNSKVRFLDAVLISNALLDTATVDTASTLTGHKLLTMNSSTGVLAANTGSDFYSVNNGLNDTTPGSIKLGGTLTANTTIDIDSYNLLFSITSGTGNFQVNSNGNNIIDIDYSGDLKISSANHNSASDYAIEIDYSADEIFINNDIKINGTTSPNTNIDNSEGGISLNIEESVPSETLDINVSSGMHTVIVDNLVTDINLPPVLGNNGRILIFKWIANGGGACDINPSGAELIDDAATYTLDFTHHSFNPAITLQCDEVNDRWVVISEFSGQTS